MLTRTKKYFLTGLLAILPMSATFYIFLAAYNFLTSRIEKIIPVKKIAKSLISKEDSLEPWLPVVTFIIGFLTLIIIFFIVVIIGYIVANMLNKSRIAWFENMIMKIPLAKPIYGTFKQISDLVLSKDNVSYKKAVLVEYPRKGLWSLGLLTKNTNFIAESSLGEKVICNIFIPTSPNPTSGMFIMIPKEDIVELDIKIDDAFKMIVSGGAIIPENLLGKKGD